MTNLLTIKLMPRFFLTLKMKIFNISETVRDRAFYSEIPLPFPNSSYLLEPSNPMANAEIRFLRLCNNLNQAIGLQ